MCDVLGFIVDLSIQLTLTFWRPAASEEYVLYILSGLWGMSDGIWQTQINGLFKLAFPSLCHSKTEICVYRT